jgi:phosphate uptake regulator
MRRKIVKQGRNTFTVSLPRKWCERNKISEGEEIDVLEKGDNLLLSKELSKGRGEVRIDVTNLDRSTIILLILSLYRYGYDKIVVSSKQNAVKYYLHNKEVSISSVVQDAVTRLIGAEITSTSRGAYSIEVITEDSREKFDTVLRRIFLLIMEMFEGFLEGIKKKDRVLMEEVAVQHVNIKKFINYARRLLNKFGYKDAEKTNFYFSTVAFLGKMDEIIKNFTGFVLDEKHITFSKKLFSLLEEIRNSLKMFYDSFYKYDVQKIGEMHRKRDLFKRRLYKDYSKFSKDDLFVISTIMQIFDVLLDLSEFRMAIGYS